MTDWSARIREVTFSTVKLDSAYDMDQVDYLLDMLQAAADDGRPLGPVLDDVEVKQVRLREGYDLGEVDAFFAEVRAADDAPASVPPEVPVASPAPPPAPAPAPPPAVVGERRGFFARLFGR